MTFQFEILIPITLFICIVYAIKAVVDARTRRRIIESHGSEDLVRSLLEGEVSRRRQSSLHWGSVLLALAVGFGLIEWMDVERLTPGVLAVLLGATGVGNLAYYLLDRHSKAH